MIKKIAIFSLLTLHTSVFANVLINLPAKTMWVDTGEEIVEYPVAVGKISSQSPVGEFKISEIRKNPAWYVPASIQKEMASKGKNVQTVVQSGPKNPLGTVFVRLGQTSYGFHGTNVPSSIGYSVSHGCIRMNNDHVKEVAKLVKRGDDVKLVYEPVVLDLSNDRPLLTIYPNIYQKKNKYNLEKVLDHLDENIKSDENITKITEALRTMEKRSRGEPVIVEL